MSIKTVPKLWTISCHSTSAGESNHLLLLLFLALSLFRVPLSLTHVSLLCFMKLTCLVCFSLLDTMFLGDASMRNKFNLILCETMEPYLAADDYMDKSDYENELKQVMFSFACPFLSLSLVLCLVSLSLFP